MTPTETADFLRRYNEWRRGDEDISQFDPREIGEAIDATVEMIERLEEAETAALEQARLNGMGSERDRQNGRAGPVTAASTRAAPRRTSRSRPCRWTATAPFPADAGEPDRTHWVRINIGGQVEGHGAVFRNHQLETASVRPRRCGGRFGGDRATVRAVSLGAHR